MRGSLAAGVAIVAGLMVGRPWPAQAEPDAMAAAEKQARAAYEKDRYGEAAVAYEALWAKYQVPKFLYVAGIAREGMGHAAHALWLWRMYLERPELTAQERSKAEARVAAVERRLTPITIAGTTQRPRCGAIEARYEGPKPSAERSPLVMPGETEKVFLEPGMWTLKCAPEAKLADAYAGAEAAVTVTAGQESGSVALGLTPVMGTVRVSGGEAEIRVVFSDELGVAGDEQVTVRWSKQLALRVGAWRYTARRGDATIGEGRVVVTREGTTLALAAGPKREKQRRAGSPERRARIGLGAGLGTAGTAMGAAGLGIFVVENRNKDRLIDGKTTDGAEGINVLRNVGGGLVGATVGLWVGAITGAARPSARAAWWTELGVGAAVLAGGLTWNILETNKFNAAIANNETASFLEPLLAAEVAGLGAGLIGGAISGLVVERRLRGKTSGLAWIVRPSASPRFVGVRVAAEF